MIGKDQTSFKLYLDKEFFNTKDILVTSNKKEVEVISEPTLHYGKWYWKILNFLTFKLFFNIEYAYICKIKN